MNNKKFNFNETKVAKVAEEIRDEEHKTTKQTTQQLTTAQSEEAEQPLSESVKTEASNVTTIPASMEEQNVVINQSQKVKAKKSSSGIVIDMPIEDYVQLTMLKIQTGCTLKELALKAIHEFVERNKIG